jgi:glycerate dehydrogenase
MAWATTEARQRMMKIVEENLSSFLSGGPRNVVNP